MTKLPAIERQQGSSSVFSSSYYFYANRPEGVSLRVVKKKFKVQSKCGIYVSYT